MGKGKGRHRHKSKKKKTDGRMPSSESGTPAEDPGSPKRKVPSNSVRSNSIRSNSISSYSVRSHSVRSRSEYSSDGTESICSVNENKTIAASTQAAGPSVGGSKPAKKNTAPASTAVAAKEKPPPIMVKNVELAKLMKELEAGKIPAEFKLCRIGVKVMTASRKDYDAVIAYLKRAKAQFYSHDFSCDKPFKAVVKGLPTMDTKVIEAELITRYKLKPLAVYPMKWKDEDTRKYQDRFYLVHFQKGTVTTGALKAVRTIGRIVCRWEPYRGSKNDTQCQRCLDFGHGTRNCNCKPRCANCAQGHQTADCLLQEEFDPKCANCKGKHRGNDRSCPKREEYRVIRKNASTSNQRGRKNNVPPAPVLEERSFPALQRKDTVTTQPVKPTWVEQQTSNSPSRTVPSESVLEEEEEQLEDPLPEKYGAEKLLEIFDEMVTELQKCKQRRDQIRTLGHFIVKYGC